MLVKLKQLIIKKKKIKIKKNLILQSNKSNPVQEEAIIKNWSEQN